MITYFNLAGMPVTDEDDYRNWDPLRDFPNYWQSFFPRIDKDETSRLQIQNIYEQAYENLSDFHKFVYSGAGGLGIEPSRILPALDGSGNYRIIFRPGDPWYAELEQRGIARKEADGRFIIPSNLLAAYLPGYGLGEADDMSTIGPMVAMVIMGGAALSGAGAGAGASEAIAGESLILEGGAGELAVGESAFIEGATGESFLVGDAATDTLIEETIMDDILANDIWGTENFSFAEDFSFPEFDVMDPSLPGEAIPDLIVQQNTLPAFADRLINQGISLGAKYLGSVISPQTTRINPTPRAPANPFYNPLPGAFTELVNGDVNPYAPAKSGFTSYITIGIVLVLITFLGLFLSRR